MSPTTQSRPLRDVCTLEKGKPPLQTSYNGPGAERYLTPDFLRGKAEPEYARPSSDAIRVIDGETIILWDGSNAGEVLRARDGMLASTMMRVSHNSDYDTGYFYYALKGWEDYLKGQTAGSGIPHVDKEIFGALSLSNYQKPEQTKIAEILSTVDQAIEQTEALIAKQQRIKTGLMQDLLTRGIDENGNLRSEETHEFKDSPLGRIPVEWESAYFQSCISGGPKNGIYKPQSAYGEQGTPIIRIDGFSHGDRIKAQSHRRVRLSKPEVEQFSLRYGDILINRVNSIQYLGKTALVEHLPEVTVFESNMMRLAIDPQRMLPEFALLILTSSATLEHFLSSAKLAIAQASINQDDVNSLRVQLPPLEEQHTLCERMVSIDDSIRDTLLSLKKLRQIKTALMQDLLTGKVSVAPLLTDTEGSV